MPRRVLVVEDDERSRRLLVDVLGHHGFEVAAAESGEAALELAGRMPPDVALLDIQLPGIDGFEVLRRLREREPLRPIPILALTASVMQVERARILASGFDACMPKPLDLPALRILIDTLVPERT